MSLNEFCEELEVLLENSPYALEIINHLKEKENEHIPYLCQSPQLEFRYQLINKMRNYCYEVKLSVITMHLAVHLLDYFMDNYSIVHEKLKFVAFVCISLSAKFEGDESFRTSHLKRLNKNKDCGAEFLVLELKILGFFNWNLSQPTVAYFLEFYRWLSVFRQDCINVSPNNLRKEAFSIIAKIQDTTLDDHRMNKFKPSLVAACCIFSTREVLKLCPKWPIVLENITGYAEDDFNSCYNLLKSIYMLRYNCGYRFSEDESSDSTTSEDSEVY